MAMRSGQSTWPFFSPEMCIRDSARAMCPLARFGTRGLDPEFVRAVRDAVRLIAADPEGEAFLEKWAAREAEYELF